MSRPAALRYQGNPFIQRKRQTGSKKLGLDFDRLNPSDNLRQDHLDNSRRQQVLTAELQRAEREGKYSKAKKMRRLLNQALEEALWLRSTWCQTCLNVLHNCKCEGE
jgi:hypothetical protein